VVVVNSSVAGTSVHRADLVAVFWKKAEHVLHMPVMAVVQYWGKQLTSMAASALRPPIVKASDDEVLVYVAKTSGAVGYVSSGTSLPPGVKVVNIID
jgi:hypothetical protein